MTFVMSTSLKVVSMAAVFCACFRRSAMRLRRRVMRTRSSRAPVWRGRPRAAGGRLPAAAAGVGAGGRRRRRDRASCRAPPGTSARRPWSGGRPCRWPGWPRGSSLFSAISLRTAGDSGSAAAAGCGARLGRRLGCRLGGRASPPPAAAAVADHAEHRADLDRLPASTRISLSAPAAGALTSSVTLSVSSSTSGSSTVDRVAVAASSTWRPSLR